MKTYKVFVPLFALFLLTDLLGSNSEDAVAQIKKIPSHIQNTSTQPKVAPKSPQMPFYDTDPSPVHEWIALQAYNKLPSSALKDSLANYLPTDDGTVFYSIPFYPPDGWWYDDDGPYIRSWALIEGTWEEDRGDEIFEIAGHVLYKRYFNHFWNPDGDYDDGLFFIWPWSSALEMAQDHFQKAVSYYNSGNTTAAYYWLGRTAHLLMDLTVPAHVQLDPHPGPLGDGDNYEEFTGSWEFHYKHITSSSPSTTIPSVPFTTYPGYTPPQFNGDLTNLFYQLANKTDEFDSDDQNGDSYTYGNGKYRRASNTIDAYKVFKRAYKLSGGNESLLDTLSDYIIVNCAWSHDASIIYSESFFNEIWPDPFNLYGVRVYYTDNSYENFSSPDVDGVPWAVCGEIFQSQLQSRAIGYTAALYQLFWNITHPLADDNYEENDDIAHAYNLSAYWSNWLHNINGLGVHLDHDWYRITVPSGVQCLYVECRFLDSAGDIDITLCDASGTMIEYSSSDTASVERICYESPAPGTYFIDIYQYPYNGNTYDLWWGSNCTEKIVLSSPLDGYWFASCNPEIYLRWNLADEVDKITRYEVQLDDNPGFSSPCEMAWNDMLRDYAEACYECGNLATGTYYWRVRARTHSPCNLFGEWSDTWSFKVGCPELTIDQGTLSPPNGSSGPITVLFDWAAVLHAGGYAFQIDTVNSSFGHLWCDEVVFESQVTKTIPLVDSVYWRVRALGPGTCSDGPWTSPCVYHNEIIQPDFALSVKPDTQTVSAGNSVNYNAILTSVNGFASPCSLMVSGLPAGASGSFSPNPAIPTDTSIMTVNTSAGTTPLGNYNLIITARKFSPTVIQHSDTVVLQVTSVTCSEQPKDNGLCDTLRVTCPDTNQAGAGPWLVRFPLWITHDVPNATVDSISAMVIPLCYSRTNPSKFCSVSSYYNRILWTAPNLPRSIFRHLVVGSYTTHNWMMDLFNAGNGAEWNTIILDYSTASPHFWLSLIPTGQEDPRFGQGNHVLIATMTFRIQDTMHVSIDTCFWPPSSHLTFSRADVQTYIPRDNMPATFEITVQDFTIAASPDTQTVVAGNSTSFDVNLGSLHGFSNPVTLSMSVIGSSTGITSDFTSNPVTPPGPSTMNVHTTVATVPATYKLIVTGTYASVVHKDTVVLRVDPSSAVEEEEVGKPIAFALYQSYPNPFNPTTNIEFDIPIAVPVRIEIFNILGQKVRILVDENMKPGRKLAVWDGKDDDSRDVSSGIYFYHLQAGEFAQTKKMILLR